MTIRFEKATLNHLNMILGWLNEPHMIEFWDNSQEHRDDIKNFVGKRPQTYFAGTTKYWIGYYNNIPYAFILSDILQPDQDLPNLYRQHLSQKGHTISLDFGIGNTDLLGKGLAAPTLQEFMIFYSQAIDPLTDTFFIDPDQNNPKAQRVYEKAGFVDVGDYQPTKGAFVGQTTRLMLKQLLGRSSK